MTQQNGPVSSVPFSFAQFMQGAANSIRHPYFDATVFVTNSGLYKLDIAEARINERRVNGVARSCIEVRAFAQHQAMSGHDGRVFIRIDVPNPADPHPYDINFQSFAIVSGVCEFHQDQAGNAYLVPNFGEKQVTKFNSTFTELTNLKGKKLMAVMRAQPSNGRIFMNASAFFTAEGYSASEAAAKAQGQNVQPTEFSAMIIPPYEGFPPEPVQKQATQAAGAANAFSANLQHPAPQMQQANAAPQPPQAAPAPAFAAPQAGGFGAPQAPQAAPAPAFAAPAPQSQATEPQQPQGLSPFPVGSKDDEDIPF